MGLISLGGKALLKLLPARSEFVYRFGKAIVDRYNNDNNCEMERNGEFRFLKEALPDSRVVFDIGANVGDWTKQALQINPEASYHCFEPSPTTFGRLSAAGLPANVTLNNVGLGNEEREMALYISEGDSTNNSLYDRRKHGSEPATVEKVRIETLDGYREKAGIDHIDFIKLDVEGNELSALQGGRKLLSEGRVSIIQFEYGGTYIDAGIFLKNVWEFVKDTNSDYSFHKIYPQETRPIPAYGWPLETFQYSNWVIMNSKWSR